MQHRDGLRRRLRSFSKSFALSNHILRPLTQGIESITISGRERKHGSSSAKYCMTRRKCNSDCSSSRLIVINCVAHCQAGGAGLAGSAEGREIFGDFSHKLPVLVIWRRCKKREKSPILRAFRDMGANHLKLTHCVAGDAVLNARVSR